LELGLGVPRLLHLVLVDLDFSLVPVPKQVVEVFEGSIQLSTGIVKEKGIARFPVFGREHEKKAIGQGRVPLLVFLMVFFSIWCGDPLYLLVQVAARCYS
jgi:hypothetical protein